MIHRKEQRCSCFREILFVAMLIACGRIYDILRWCDSRVTHIVRKAPKEADKERRCGARCVLCHCDTKRRRICLPNTPPFFLDYRTAIAQQESRPPSPGLLAHNQSHAQTIINACVPVFLLPQQMSKHLLSRSLLMTCSTPKSSLTGRTLRS